MGDADSVNMLDVGMAQISAQTAINQYYYSMLIQVQKNWRQQLDHVNNAHYLQTFKRPPPPPADFMSKLDYYRQFSTRLWHHYVCCPPYAFDDILDQIKVGFHCLIF